MRDTAIEPNIQDVGFFTKLRFARFWMLISHRQYLFHRSLEPRRRATTLDHLRNTLKYLFVVDRFTGRHSKKNRNSNPPRSLARNAPIRPIRHHGCDARLALLRDPLDAIDFLQRPSTQFVVVDIDEPLFGCSINNWFFVTLAVRIAVSIFVRVKQVAGAAQPIDDELIGLG